MNIRGVIPEVINQFNLYDASGVKQIGVGDEIELPELETITDTISGGGIMGEIEDPVMGQFGSITMTIPFRVIHPNMTGALQYNGVTGYVIRGVAQCIDPKSYETGTYNIRVVVRGKTKRLALGTFAKGKKSESEVELEVFYFKVEINKEVVLELDKLNEIFIVNGEDVMSEVRSLS